MKKVSNTEAELKKSLFIQKKRIFSRISLSKRHFVPEISRKQFENFRKIIIVLRKFLFLNKGPSIKYVRKIFRKTNISNPLIRTHSCAYQGVRNVSFSENFAYVLNKLSSLCLEIFYFEGYIQLKPVEISIQIEILFLFIPQKANIESDIFIDSRSKEEITEKMLRVQYRCCM